MAKKMTRAASKARTRERVLAAAKAVFGEEGGYAAATIREIAKRAEMSTGAVFASFKNKAELYEAVKGRPPISSASTDDLFDIVRALALNGHHLKAEEPFGGALEQLLVLARGRVAQIWPEGLRSDASDDFRVTPEEALSALAELEAAQAARAASSTEASG